LGGECAGVVSAVGEGVMKLRVGDRVAGLVRGAVASEVVARADRVALLPPDLDFETAASLPLAYVIAEIALGDLARVGPGDRVFIHAGAGGVGVAAVEIALRRGACVLASAGDERRRAALRERGLERVIDSRDPSVVDAVMSWSGEAGVDAILSADSDEIDARLMALLAPGGRLVDLRHSSERGEGGRARASVPANRASLPLDLEEWCAPGAVSVSCRLERIFAGVAAGTLAPLPGVLFPIAELDRALRFAAQGRHVGKVCLDFGESEQVPIAPPLRRATSRFEPRATYVITGSDPDAIALHTRWMLARGVRRLVVVPARPHPLGAWRPVEALAGEGAQVSVAQGSLEATLKALDARDERLLGVVHAVAGQVAGSEAALAEVDILRRVHATTLAMCSHLDFLLHLHPADDLLEAGLHPLLVGLRVHAEALCEQARGRGHRAISVGVLAEGGASAADRRRAGEALAELVGNPGADAISVAAPPERWPADVLAHSPRLAHFAGVAGGAGLQVSAATPVALLRDLPSDEREERLRAIVDERVAAVLSLHSTGPSAFDRDAPLADLGLDSLLALELRLTLDRELEIELPPTFFADGPSARTLGESASRCFAAARSAAGAAR
jgi:NADPH:quinone reductase-like Zn-dependent oxidoreductase/acyl carrier protein